MAVELSAEVDPRVVVTEWNFWLARERQEDRAESLRAMAVLMRVAVGRISAHRCTEPLGLQGHVSGDDALDCALGRDKRPRSSPNPNRRNLEMASDAEVRVPASIAASEATGRFTIRLALVTIPALMRLDIVRLTPELDPKSSAFTMSSRDAAG